MDGSVKTRTDIDVLKGLIAGLLALAGLAERIADRSFPIRVLVLWVLGRSERLAWGHIPEDVLSPFVVHHRYSRIHAQHFAWLFKTAAYCLRRKLREKQRFARKWAKWETRRVNEAIGDDPQEPRIGGLLFRQTCISLRRLHGLFIAPLPRLDSS